MTHDLEGVCDGCSSAGLIGDHCPNCGGIFRDLDVGVEEQHQDDDPATYPPAALADDDAIPLDAIKKPDTADEI